jgi:hypothetical protein
MARAFNSDISAELPTATVERVIPALLILSISISYPLLSACPSVSNIMCFSFVSASFKERYASSKGGSICVPPPALIVPIAF